MEETREALGFQDTVINIHQSASGHMKEALMLTSRSVNAMPLSSGTAVTDHSIANL